MAKPCPSSGVHFNSTKNVLLAASALASARNAKHKKTIEMATSINGSTGPSHGSQPAGANDRNRTKELIALVVILMVKPWNDQQLFQPMHRSEEHTSELQSLMRISYAVFCLKKKKIPCIKNN